MGYYRRRTKVSDTVALNQQLKKISNHPLTYPRIRVENPDMNSHFDAYIECPDSTEPVEQTWVVRNRYLANAHHICQKADISLDELSAILAEGRSHWLENKGDSLKDWCFDTEKDSPRRVVWNMNGWGTCMCRRCGSTGDASRRENFGKIDEEMNGCRKCGGTGLRSRWEVKPTSAGKKMWVFPASWTNEECTNFIQVKIDKVESARIAKVEARKQRQLEKVADALATNDRMMIVETGCTLEEIKNACPNNSFIRDVCDKGMNGVVLSLKQLEALGNAYDRQMGRDKANEEYKKTASEVPSGRHEVVGEVLSVKWKDSHYGGAYKALVKTSDYKVYGTVPSALVKACGGDPTLLEGSTIKFTATLTPKEVGFGFYSRPTNAVEV